MSLRSFAEQITRFSNDLLEANDVRELKIMAEEALKNEPDWLAIAKQLYAECADARLAYSEAQDSVDNWVKATRPDSEEHGAARERQSTLIQSQERLSLPNHRFRSEPPKHSDQPEVGGVSWHWERWRHSGSVPVGSTRGSAFAHRATRPSRDRWKRRGAPDAS